MTDHKDPRRAEELEDEMDLRALREAIAADDGTRISSAEMLRQFGLDAQTPADGAPPTAEQYFTANPDILNEELTDENTTPRRPR